MKNNTSKDTETNETVLTVTLYIISSLGEEDQNYCCENTNEHIFTVFHAVCLNLFSLSSLIETTAFMIIFD